MQEIESPIWILDRPIQTRKKVLPDGLVAQKNLREISISCIFFQSLGENIVDVGNIFFGT